MVALEKMNRKKIKLIYIASNGRSGSTLLDMMVGKHKLCHTLGEFQMLTIDYKLNLQPCGCGSKVSECIFWSDIYRQQKRVLTKGNIDKFRKDATGKVLRVNEIAQIMFGKKIDRKAIDKYGYENFQVMKTIHEKVNTIQTIEYLIDASKDPYRLKWLIQSNYFDIFVLHIIKRPEAFVYSTQKQEKKFTNRLRITIRMSFRWVIENYIIFKVCNKYLPPNHYIKIKYEEFCLDPNKELNQIFDVINLPKNNTLSDSFSHINHAISGNTMRFKSDTIKLDEKWKGKLHLLQKILVMIITRIFKKKIY